MKTATHALLLAFVLLAPAALADADHETARRLRDQGTILPLQEILSRAARLHPAQILEVELEEHDGRYVYELDLLGPGGRVSKAVFDAHDGRLLSDRPEGHGEP